MATQPFGIRIQTYSAPYYYDLPNVQSISFMTGRMNITDNWQGSSVTVYGRDPSALTSIPTIGASCIVYWNDITGTFAAGIVSDWRVIYGTIPALDTWELTLESGWGQAGRKTGTVTTSAGASTFDMAYNITGVVGPGLAVGLSGSAYPWSWGSTTSAQTITGQMASALTTLMQTEQGYVRDDWTLGSGSPSAFSKMWGRNAGDTSVKFATFSDAATLAFGEYRYTEIEFLSAAYNYGAVVNVDASGFATQTSGTGTYAQNYSTINGSASEAANLAGYLQAELNLATAVPYRLTTTGAATQGQIANGAPTLANMRLMKQALTLVFRGNTYQCVVEGIQFQANPSGWTLNYYLSSSLQNAFLRLDNSVYGTLGNNRLGF